jgi:hypothetical protein
MVYYQERDFTLPFYWESTTVGFDVYLQNPDKWAAFCEEHNAGSAIERRDEIVARWQTKSHVKRLGAQRLPSKILESLAHMEGSWFRAILRKILGLD